MDVVTRIFRKDKEQVDSEFPVRDQTGSEPIAPVWHTLIVVSAMLGLSFLSAHQPRLTHIGPFHGHIATYLAGILMEWLFLGFIWYGIRLRGVRLRDLVGGKTTFVGTLNDFGIAFLFLIGSSIILKTLFSLIIALPNPIVRRLAPRGSTEILLFLLLALTSGVCEEVICRGYLQIQFTALTKSSYRRSVDSRVHLRCSSRLPRAQIHARDCCLWLLAGPPCPLAA
jgi:hypothetical protein